ncbi:penicillin acylase family protein [Chengkuizengella sediminis]|uniref:penicillin acylase family protein n=1 Tax=Chengkuizengella sediminis TaxID=1885917 RepID=UPI001389667D|nr:penicillin acylase family protein [Chengkuizengella sediminis]NDI36901.1 penicillin acylase family protein [Chengkuizengella sediminis]
MESTIDKRKRFLFETKRRRIVFFSVSFFIVLFFVLIAAAYFYLLGNKPQTNGEIAVSGLQEEVSVYRDEWGVPHIEANNLNDLFFAQGYVTAQERIFQMDMIRRQASGHLSEVIGEKTIEKDKFFRAIGLHRVSKETWEILSEETQQILVNYAKGVNVYIEEAMENGDLPIEFQLMGYKPEKWTVFDSILVGKYMAYDLGGYWEAQAFRYYLAQNFSDEHTLDLFPSYPEGGATVIQALRDQPLDIKDRFASVPSPNELNGSNNWVLSGQKTESGFPYLANDPHLGLATPSIWLETHLTSPDFEVSGVIVPGAPGVILGRNQHIAWGITNVGPDVQDLYIERRNPDNEYEFEYKGKWEQAEIIEEPISVKGKDMIDYQVIETRHGPIISEFAHDEQSDTALALKWTALEPSPELDVVLKFGRAKDWGEFKEALTYFYAPASNFVFASKDGDIAYRANGLIPIRKNGESLVPVPGWTGEYEWEGYIPWEELPTIVNPEEGFISTANNKIVTDDYPYHLSNIWAQPYRQQRIRDVLLNKDQFSIEEMKRLQLDIKNLYAEEFVPIFVSLLKNKELRSIDQQVMEKMIGWNFEDEKDLAEPLVFHFWMEEIKNVLFEEKIDDEMLKLFKGKSQVVDELIRKAYTGKPGPWITDAGGLEDVVSTALKRSVDRAVELQGKDMNKWTWGDYHQILFSHPLAAIKPLNLLFNSSALPVSGSDITVGAASWKSETGEVNHGASWRTVMDLANMSESYSVVGPGQSGHVMSENYHDQMDDWAEGGYHVTSTDPVKYRKHADLLLLKPE